MKRIFELNMKDIEEMDRQKLGDIIRNSEGRTVMSETVVACEPHTDGVSNPELAAAFGADLITLNLFNFSQPFIPGIDDLDIIRGFDLVEHGRQLENRMKENHDDPGYGKKVRSIVGRLLGVNMEPIPEGTDYPEGFRMSRENLLKVRDYGFSYIVLTGNPGTGVNEETLLSGVRLTREVLGDGIFIIAGKMHGAGSGNILDHKVYEQFIDAGADCILIPAPGTVPGFTLENAKGIIDLAHSKGALAMTAIGTSQEGASSQYIENLAMVSKMAGADIQHIGDAGNSGIAMPENIMALSIAIRGRRHTYRRMACSMRK